MNRFDKNFNDVDPETSRPFSGGHPDGAWIIAILYSYILFVALLSALFDIYQSIFGGKIQLVSVVSTIFAYGLLLPLVILLFKRSRKAITWCGFLFAASLFALVLTYIFDGGAVTYWLAVSAVQGYIFFYVYGLSKDKLLIN